jgi:hypothetical protein
MSLKVRSIAAALLTTCGLMSIKTLPAKAYSLDIVNAGFEDPGANYITPGQPLAPGEYSPNGVIPGWQVYDPQNLLGYNPVTGYNPAGNVANGTFDSINILRPATGPNYDDYGVADAAAIGNGATVVYLTDPPGTTAGAGIQQTLNDVLAPNTTYTLTAKVYNPKNFKDFPLDPNSPGLTDLGGLPGYNIQLLADGNVIAQDNNSLGSSIPEGEGATSIVTFTTGDNSQYLGQQLGIRLVDINVSKGLEIGFDDVKLDATPVPEPSALLGLLAVGGIGYSMKRRKLAK